MTDDDHDLLMTVLEKLDAMAEDVRSIKTRLFGNGSRGLCERVALIEVECQRRVEAGLRRRSERWALWVAISAAVIGGIAGMIAVVR